MYDGFYSIEKDSIATTRDSFKDCILACKISNQMYIDLEKRKVPQAAVPQAKVPRNGCSVRHIFSKIFFFICGQSS